jgi:polyhydroxyalkanoate synthase
VVDVALGTSRAQVAQTASELIWEKGSATLRRFGASGGGGEAVLIVHSLVSKPWILDLTPGRSFIEFLVQEGFDVYLIDWGEPGPAQAEVGLSTCTELLMQAEREVLKHAAGNQLHLVGYCLGGLVCLLRAGAREHHHIASIALVATPVDFSIPVALQPWISHRFLFKPAYFLDGSGCVPSQAIRESFHFLRPQALRTVINAWRHRKDPEFRSFYDPLARWVWEHRPLPGRTFFDLVELFRWNGLLKGTVSAGGEIARLEDVKVPVLTLIAERDHIVPSDSSRALSTVRGLDVTMVNMASGHVSMVSGISARSTTWPTIASWIRERS